jgi:hypothetical protein
MTKNLLDFLEYGIKYVYPTIPGTIQRGMATAHSAPPLNKLISSDRVYVWPWAEGLERGEGIELLHVSVPNACIKDSIYRSV